MALQSHYRPSATQGPVRVSASTTRGLVVYPLPMKGARLICNAVQDTERVTSKAPDTAPSNGDKPKRSNGGPPPPPKPKAEIRPFPLIAIDQAMDTVSDVWRHAARQLVPPPSDVMVELVEESGGKVRRAKPRKKPTVLVLGSGWGAHSLIKVIDTDVYDVVLVSPRNHFVFTPMLPSTAVGTVEFRSVLEPIRTSNPFVEFYEATCDVIDPERKVATCTAAFTLDGKRPTFEITYDILVTAVGETPATFGVKGVRENCFFMKEVTDTVALRNRIGECFELAALPGTSAAARERLLSFVVVGGGPTGVEFAGTLSDFLRIDLKRKYPQLIKYVQVTLLQSGQGILTQFDSRLAQRALDNLVSTGVTVRTGVRVVEVTPSEVVLTGGERLEYGVCVWSTGNAANSLVQQLVDKIPAQVEFNSGRSNMSRKLLVDPFLRVVGGRDIIALGDCSYVCNNPLPATAQVAGQQGAYVAHMVNRGYHLGVGGENAPGPSRPAVKGPLGLPLPAPVQDLSAQRLALMSYGADDQLRSNTVGANGDVSYYRREFEFLSLGIMAYVGNNSAVTQFEPGQEASVSLRLYGRLAFLLWRSVYITKQVSFRNRVLILFDWLKARVFGRDTSLF